MDTAQRVPPAVPLRRTRRLRSIVVCVLVLTAVFLIPAPPAFSATIVVNTTDDEDNIDGDCSLREAILAAAQDLQRDACPPGNGADVVFLPPGTYYVSGSIMLSTELELRGNGAGVTFLDGGGTSKILRRSGTLVNVTITDLTLQNGYAGIGDGGSCFHQGSGYTTTMTHVRFLNCTAGGRGGAIYSAGTLIMEDSFLQGNTASGGPTAYNSGGAVYTTGGDLTFIRTTFMDNIVDSTAIESAGGAIHHGSSGGQLTIIDSTFTGNEARSEGAIIAFGTVYIEGSLFYDNSGGAIVLATSGVSNEIVNSTVSGNSGGGVASAGDIWVRSSTLANNTGGFSIYANPGTAHLKNSILVRTDGDNCAGTISSDGYNIDNVGTCSLLDPTDLLGVDPMLETLGNNSGPTRTHALPAVSPAIDAGDPAGCTDSVGSTLDTDQRGLPRHVDSDLDGTPRCDIGAYERQISTVYLPLISR